MALTILEASKLNPGNVVRDTIIETFARSSAILGALPFEDIPGGALVYNREQTLPGVGFRGVNEAYTESTGILNPITEALTIAGGDLDVDRAIVKTRGEQQRSVQELMKVKALALRWTETFIKGDSITEPREFDGLQKRIAGNQLVSNGSTSGGDALSLFNLDSMISKVLGRTHLIMNETMRLRLTQASRLATVGGHITFDQDELGRQVTRYNGLPILIADEDEAGTAILGFTEAGAGGGTTSTSIYCVSFTEGMLNGIQNGTMEVRDLGEIDTQPVFRTRVEWLTAIAAYHGRCAARLYGVSNAAVVV